MIKQHISEIYLGIALTAAFLSIFILGHKIDYYEESE